MSPLLSAFCVVHGSVCGNDRKPSTVFPESRFLGLQVSGPLSAAAAAVLPLSLMGYGLNVHIHTRRPIGLLFLSLSLSNAVITIFSHGCQLAYSSMFIIYLLCAAGDLFLII